MRESIKALSLLLLSIFTLESYAIEVKVHSPSSEVAALGFMVNGKKYGMIGNSYHKDNMPKGAAYIFGVRVGGIFGKDVGCFTQNGEESVILNTDSSAILDYHTKQCIVQVNPTKSYF